MENVPGAEEKMKSGELIMGNIDSWLMWKLSGGRMHVTDYSNASRTMLFNVQELNWDQKFIRYHRNSSRIFLNQNRRVVFWQLLIRVFLMELKYP